MSCRSHLERLLRLFLTGLALACLAPAAGAAPQVGYFDATTWQTLRQSAPRPLAVVFSTTDCAHCPKVIQALADTAQRSGKGARLLVVLMDGQGQERHVMQDKTYRRARALYVFDGDEAALRYSVNPEWRGLTPYVALIGKDGETRFHTGMPPPEALGMLGR